MAARTVRRLPVDPGPAGWARLLPDPPPPTPLTSDTTADWLIIGAGFAGLAAARQLTQVCPGDRIVILDAARVGDGPAGRNSGFMIDLPHDLASQDYGGALDTDRAQTEDNRRAIGFAADMAAEFGLGDEAFIQSGKINGAASAKGHRHNVDFAAHLTAMAEPHDMLSAQDMRAITGTDYYRSGLRTPGSAMIQPALFVRGVADRLRSGGVALHELSPVTGLTRNGDWTAQTPKARVTAPRVILAVNGHLESFGFLPGRLIHVHTYASMTRALTQAESARLGGDPRWGITPADPLGTTVRRISGTGGDRIVIRNRFTYDPTLHSNPAHDAGIARDHDHAFAARFPMLDGVGMDYRWGGRLCLSRNNVQIIAELEAGLFCACCQNGLGTAKGTLAGLLAAELAAGIGSPELDRALAAPRPARLPPRPLATMGARLRIRYGERKAGAEF